MSQNKEILKQLRTKLIVDLISDAFKAGARHNDYENAFTWNGSEPIPDTLEQYIAKIKTEFADLME